MKSLKEKLHTAYQIAGAYCLYSEEEVYRIFDFFRAEYERRFLEIHPEITMHQLIILIRKLADNESIEKLAGYQLAEKIPVELYEDMIEDYMKIPFKKHHINHFFTGDIRGYRFLENAGFIDTDILD